MAGCFRRRECWCCLWADGRVGVGVGGRGLVACCLRRMEARKRRGENIMISAAFRFGFDHLCSATRSQTTHKCTNHNLLHLNVGMRLCTRSRSPYWMSKRLAPSLGFSITSREVAFRQDRGPFDKVNKGTQTNDSKIITHHFISVSLLRDSSSVLNSHFFFG